jgi:ribosome maturation factor RimP
MPGIFHMGDLEEAGSSGNRRRSRLEKTGLTDAAQLTELVEPEVKRLGFELVRVSLQGTRNLSLQIMAEDPKTGQLTLDQCADISRAVSTMLDEKDPIDREYRLEVSSPGIDRPLTRAKDWTQWAGHEAKVTLHEAIDGRKRFQGIVRGVDGDAAVLDLPESGEVRLPLADILTAKLTLTDALIKASKPLSTEGADDIIEEKE